VSAHSQFSAVWIVLIITFFATLQKDLRECRGRQMSTPMKTGGYRWHGECIFIVQMLMIKEDTKMKNTTYTKKLAYMGAGCGVVLFAVFGLLPGSFLGGVMGLNLAGIVFGTPVGPGLLPRMIVAASMVIGVMVSGTMFIMASTTLGWLAGTVVDAIKSEKKELVTVEHK